MELGIKVRNSRKAQQLTLDELSDRSGVAKATLSKIENSLILGTLKTHQKIAEALSMPLTDLYVGLGSASKGEDLATIEPGAKDTEVFTYDERALSILLAKQVAKKKMLPSLLVIEEGGKTSKEENAAGTEKFVYCTEGQVKADVGEKTFELKKGSSLYFNSSLSHSFANTGKKTAKLITVSSPTAL